MVNRIDPLRRKVTKNPTYNMKLLLGSLAPSTIIPETDKYYVFVYKAKTKGITYDAHPFIVCTSIFKWGFTGFNFHWNQSRRYTWPEVISNLYEIKENELNSMEKFPTFRRVRN